MTSARTLASLVAAGWTLFAGAASAQTYPNQPITLMVPFPAGGATDAISRIIPIRCRTTSASRSSSKTSAAPAA